MRAHPRDALTRVVFDLSVVSRRLCSFPSGPNAGRQVQIFAIATTQWEPEARRGVLTSTLSRLERRAFVRLRGLLGRGVLCHSPCLFGGVLLTSTGRTMPEVTDKTDQARRRACWGAELPSEEGSTPRAPVKGAYGVATRWLRHP